ncbi:MAG: response regulator transcription factor [Parcubacteria group bacterium]|nr:response regulator transcription factor [Parcubacteria group bacterium]
MSEDKVVVGPLTICEKERTVSAGGKSVKLHPKEMLLLALLAGTPEVAVEKTDLYMALCTRERGGRKKPAPKIIDVWICTMRKKLEDGLGRGFGGHIVTEFSVGYMLCAKAKPVDVFPKRPKNHGPEGITCRMAVLASG